MLNIDWREFAPLLAEFPNGIVAIDIETTGLSPLLDRVIELAAYKVKDGKVEVWEELFDPKIEIPQNTVDIHGISQDMVEGKPTLESLWDDFHTFCEDLPIVAHNAKFDVGFLVFATHQMKKNFGEREVYCSVKASRRAFPSMENHKLGTLAKSLKIGLENHHRASDDALACLSIFNQAIKFGPKERVLKDSRLFNTKDFHLDTLNKLPQRLSPLKKKVERQTVVDIKYKGGSHKGKFRPVKPISLLPLPGGNVLYALCLLSNLHKSFALHKISDVKELSADEIAQRFHNLKALLEESKKSI
ncbi:MAG: exonuclease domain-containing protein [Halobacteriovoraceae bacterium]|nr:exonuclease domain-containing protein [Halobacteriovoraceae bacterium]